MQCLQHPDEAQHTAFLPPRRDLRIIAPVQQTRGPDGCNCTTCPPSPAPVLHLRCPQVVSAGDASRPSRATGDAVSEGPQRLLVLRLTDGKLTCKAAEYRHCPALKECLVPGTKLAVTGASIKSGVLLLEPKCIKVRSPAAAAASVARLLRKTCRDM